MNCQAHKQNGDACKAPAIRGTTVCRVHGGSAPQVRAAAQRRLLEAADPVAARLVHLALNSDDEKVQLAACRDLLDRVAVTSPKQIEILPDAALVQQWIAALEADLADVDSDA